MIGILLRVGAVIAFAGWFVLLRPQMLGGPAAWILVVGQSMEPTVQAGSLVVAMRQAEYHIGDVVAYRIPDGDPGAGKNVIHRITGGTPDTGFVVRGDNTNAPDLWRPKLDEIVGSASIVVPNAVPVVLILRSPVVVASVAAAFATYLVLGLLAPGPASRKLVRGRDGRIRRADLQPMPAHQRAIDLPPSSQHT